MGKKNHNSGGNLQVSSVKNGKSTGNEKEETMIKKIDKYTNRLAKIQKYTRTKRVKRAKNDSKVLSTDDQELPQMKLLLSDVHYTEVGSILDTFIDGPIRQLFEGPLSDKRMDEIRSRNLTSQIAIHEKTITVGGDPKTDDENTNKTTTTTTTTTKSTIYTASVSEQNHVPGADAVANGTPSKRIKNTHADDLNDLYDTTPTKTDSMSFTNFSGFFMAGWIIIFFFVVKNLYIFFSYNGLDLRHSEIWQYMTSGVWKVALCDLYMYLSTYFVFFIQKMCKEKKMKWESTGKTLVSIYEFFFVFWFMYFAKHVLNFHWVAKIFIFLHSIVLLMKMHSYSFYNGYLWNLQKESEISKKYLKFLSDVKKNEGKKDSIAILNHSIDYCQAEISSQSPEKTDPKFPENITPFNYFEFTMFPTLVYQINYPRTLRIRKTYVFEKLMAIFGIIFVMMTVAQLFMYPASTKAMDLEKLPQSVEKSKLWVFAVIDMIPALFSLYMLTWYLIWDAILNCIAELSRFGDRNFYGDWWNSVSWNDFSKHWNIPVHQFLLRHVYHSSMSFWHFNKGQAVLFTFVLSSIFHEFAMYAMFDKCRYYIFFFQMMQLPMTWFHYKFFPKHPLLGNVYFWISMCAGPTVVCCLYLTY